MLVLQRKVTQSIDIGDNIKITVTYISGTQVKLGIDAPRDVTVIRSELKDRRDGGRKACGH